MTEPRISGRGFKHFDPIFSTYGGDVVVHESSSAMAPHLWVRVTMPEDLNAFARGEDVKMLMTSAHLTLESATELRDQLTYLIDNHYQNEDT